MSALVRLEPHYNPPGGQAFAVLHEQRLIHAALREWRETRGWTQKQVSKATGVGISVLSQIETLRTYPTAAVRTRLAALTGIPEDQLFPAWLREWITGEPPVLVTKHEVSPSELGPEDAWETTITREEIDHDVDLSLLRTVMADALDTLFPRQRWVLEMRYGLAGHRRMTFAEIGQQFGCSRERIRQIWADGLAKLRRRNRFGRLEAFLNDERRYGDQRKPDRAPKKTRWRYWLHWLASHPMQNGDLPSRLANTVLNTPCCTQSDITSMKRHIGIEHAMNAPSKQNFWDAWDEMIAALPPHVRREAA